MNTHDLYRLAEPNIARDRKNRLPGSSANPAAQHRRPLIDRKLIGATSNVDFVAVLGTE